VKLKLWSMFRGKQGYNPQWIKQTRY
jgi:hypothetical protein